MPTLGDVNVAVATGDPSTLKINEWLADGKVLFTDDFVELYNPDPLPVALGGLFLTDNPVTQPAKHEIAPLSFIAGGGYAVFAADDNGSDGPNHLDFKFAVDQEIFGLFDSAGQEIDKVLHYSQTTDVSQGRSPDGGPVYEFFGLPTPGLANPAVIETTVASFPITDVWSYNQSGDNLGTAWKEEVYPDEATWPTGGGLLYVEGSALPAPKTTPLTLGPDHVLLPQAFHHRRRSGHDRQLRDQHRARRRGDRLHQRTCRAMDRHGPGHDVLFQRPSPAEMSTTRCTKARSPCRPRGSTRATT